MYIVRGIHLSKHTNIFQRFYENQLKQAKQYFNQLATYKWQVELLDERKNEVIRSNIKGWVK